MRTKGIIVEDFVNYKYPSLFIISCYCSWKCCIEQNLDISVCQNSSLSQSDIKDINDEAIYQKFINNPITKAIVVGGLEPMIQINELINLISLFRNNNEHSPFIIYTGYYPNEIPEPINRLKKFDNIIIKFGRYIPNDIKRYDETLGIYLPSSNQWAEKVS